MAADKLHMSVARLQAEIDSDEFSRWLTYWQMEADIKAGIIRDPSADQIRGMFMGQQ